MTVVVRTDMAASAVRELAKAAATPDQARRLLAIALVLEGSSRAAAARSTGMDRQTLRDWVHRFNAAGAEGLVALGSKDFVKLPHSYRWRVARGHDPPVGLSGTTALAKTPGSAPLLSDGASKSPF